MKKNLSGFKKLRKRKDKLFFNRRRGIKRESRVMNIKIMIIEKINKERNIIRRKEEMRGLRRAIFKDK